MWDSLQKSYFSIKYLLSDIFEPLNWALFMINKILSFMLWRSVGYELQLTRSLSCCACTPRDSFWTSSHLGCGTECQKLLYYYGSKCYYKSMFEAIQDFCGLSDLFSPPPQPSTEDMFCLNPEEVQVETKTHTSRTGLSSGTCYHMVCCFLPKSCMFCLSIVFKTWDSQEDYYRLL